MASRSGTARRFRHAPNFAYCKNGQWRVVTPCDRRNTMPVEETLYRGPRREEAGSFVPWAYTEKAAIERHPAMLCHNHMAGCLHSHIGTAKILQIRWRRKGTHAPLSDRPRHPTPEPRPPLPCTQPAPTCENSRPQCSERVNCQPDFRIHIHHFPQ
jgi:hypothetical protein